MFNDATTSINPAISLDNDPIFQSSNQPELSLYSTTDSQSIDQVAARLADQTLLINPSEQPDLMITSNSIAKTLYTNNQINFTYTVNNSGRGNAGSSKTFFYLSQNNVLDSSDVLLGTDQVSAIAAQTSRTEFASFNLRGTQSPGRYYLLTQTDAQNQIGESNENNNVQAKRITIKVGQPDLLISDLTFPTSINAADGMTLFYTEQNQGTSLANVRRTSFYLSQDSSLDGRDILLGYNKESNLVAGSSVYRSKSVTIGTNVANGNYYIIGVADALQKVAELNESNNTIVQPITITDQLPDLAFEDIDVEENPLFIYSDDYVISIGFTEINQGGSLAGEHYTQTYLSTDPILDPSEDINLFFDYGKDPLEAGQSQYGYAFALVDGLTSGDYYMFIVIDAGDEVLESDETNNVSSPIPVKVVGNDTDLTFSYVSPPSVSYLSIDFTGEYFTSISMDYTEINWGWLSTNPHSVGMYLSTDDVPDSSDYRIGSSSETSLEHLIERNGFIESFVDPSIPAGDYYVYLSLDDENDEVESNENNNISTPFLVTVL